MPEKAKGMEAFSRSYSRRGSTNTGTRRCWRAGRDWGTRCSQVGNWQALSEEC